MAVLATAVALSACGSDSDGGDGGELGATGDFGEKPEITVPSGDPSDELVVDVLSEGDGAEVASGDFLVVNYLGQTWEPRDPADIPTDDPAANPAETPAETPEATQTQEESGGDPVPYVFDNSYDRGEPAGFYVGVGQLIPGWDEGLVGQRVGSRVLLSVPPDQGYGTQEGHDLAEDTLLFVVDIIEAFNAELAISGEPVEDLPEGLPTVSGDGVEEPTIDFSSAGEPVTESTSDLLIAGDGPELGENLVVKVVTASVETGEVAYSSWQQNRVEVIPPTDVATIPGLAETLEGQKEGSRVLTRISAADNPGAEGAEGEPIVLLLDIVGSF